MKGYRALAGLAPNDSDSDDDIAMVDLSGLVPGTSGLEDPDAGSESESESDPDVKGSKASGQRERSYHPRTALVPPLYHLRACLHFTRVPIESPPPT